MTSPNKIAGPNAGGPRQLTVPKSLAAPPIPKGFLAALAITVTLMIGSLYGSYHPRDWRTHAFSLMTGALPLAWLAYRRQGKNLSGGDFLLSVLSFPLVFAGCSLLERWYYRR